MGQEPMRHWKLSPMDLEARSKWVDFSRARDAMLFNTSTPHAPWYVVPSNRKWYRNLVVGTVLVSALEALDMQTPPAEPGIENIAIPVGDLDGSATSGPWRC